MRKQRAIAAIEYRNVLRREAKIILAIAEKKGFNELQAQRLFITAKPPAGMLIIAGSDNAYTR